MDVIFCYYKRKVQRRRWRCKSWRFRFRYSFYKEKKVGKENAGNQKIWKWGKSIINERIRSLVKRTRSLVKRRSSFAKILVKWRSSEKKWRNLYLETIERLSS